METYEQQTFPILEDISMSFPQEYPASRRVLPASAEAVAMSVGSGRQCSMWLDLSSPLGQFSKILLESLAWTNSAEYCYAWERLDTQFGCSAFQLTLLGQSTEESECSLLPTPTAVDHKGNNGNRNRPVCDDDLPSRVQRLWRTPTESQGHVNRTMQEANNLGKMKRRGEHSLQTQVRNPDRYPRLWPTPQAHDQHQGNAERVGRFGTKHGGRNLTDEVMTPKLWPTPTNSMMTAADLEQARYAGNSGKRPPYQQAKLWPTPVAKDTESVQGHIRSKVRMKYKTITSLGVMAKLWPTPMARDAEGTKSSTREGAIRSCKLRDHAHYPKLWPTPTERDWKSTSHGKADNSRPLSEVAGLEGKGSLNPEFVEALMMFPIGHTRLQPSASRIDHTALKP